MPILTPSICIFYPAVLLLRILIVFMKTPSYLEDLSRLFYPHQCIGCGYELYQRDQKLCSRCLKELPRTHYEKAIENHVFRLFTGRLRLERGASWLFFSKGGLTQKLIHQLKYRGNIALGVYIGQTMGTQLQKSSHWFDSIDVMVPLPLNKRKMAIRGFNQSEILCRGLHLATGLPVEEVAVMRTVHTQTQTKKSRIQRWSNVEHVFDLLDTGHLENKHALLVDDVITTGATLDACGQVLLKIPGLKLSVLSLAMASRF